MLLETHILEPKMLVCTFGGEGGGGMGSENTHENDFLPHGESN